MSFTWPYNLYIHDVSLVQVIKQIGDVMFGVDLAFITVWWLL